MHTHIPPPPITNCVYYRSVGPENESITDERREEKRSKNTHAQTHEGVTAARLLFAVYSKGQRGNRKNKDTRKQLYKPLNSTHSHRGRVNETGDRRQNRDRGDNGIVDGSGLLI